MGNNPFKLTAVILIIGGAAIAFVSGYFFHNFGGWFVGGLIAFIVGVIINK